MVKPAFSRLGGKTSLKKVILPLIPEHKTYVEPFFGGGAIFWNKEPAERSVINDLDSSVVKGLRLLKKASSDPDDYDFSVADNLEKANKFVKTTPANINQKLLKEWVITSGTFGGKGGEGNKIYSIPDYRKKVKHMPEYKERLASAKIYNQSYRPLLLKYDSKDTFFYLDPPYEKSDTDKIYKHGEMDFEEFAKTLKRLKGKWMVSINDSKRIRDLFKGYKIRKVTVRGQSQIGAGSADRKELIITNY